MKSLLVLISCVAVIAINDSFFITPAVSSQFDHLDENSSLLELLKGKIEQLESRVGILESHLHRSISDCNSPDPANDVPNKEKSITTPLSVANVKKGEIIEILNEMANETIVFMDNDEVKMTMMGDDPKVVGTRKPAKKNAGTPVATSKSSLATMSKSFGVGGESSDSSWAKLQISPDNIGSMPYGNFRVNIYEHSANQRKIVANNTLNTNKYYYAPVSLLDHKSAQSSYNNATKQAEMKFRIELWNDDIQERVVNWIKEGYDSSVNGRFVEIIPFNKLSLASESRFFQRQYQMTKDLPYAQNKDVRFKIECSILTDCSKLASYMRGKPGDFTHLRLLFRLDSERSQTRQTIIRVETLMSGEMASQMDQQIKGNEALVTAKDLQKLLQESATNILIETFDDSDVPSPDSREEIIKFLEKNLIEPGKITIKTATDKMWGSVFWDKDNYRPDVTTKKMNENYSKLDKQQKKMWADAFKNTEKTSVGASVNIPGFAEFKNGVDTENSKEGSSSREELDSFLQELKDIAQWDGNQFSPKPLSLSKVNLGKLRDAQTLQDRSVRVKYSTAVLSVAVNVAEHTDLASTNLLIDVQQKLEDRPTKAMISAMMLERPTKAMVWAMITELMAKLPDCYKSGMTPSSCTDLKCLGHRLNGFYMIKSSSGKKMEVYCDFQTGDVTQGAVPWSTGTSVKVFFSAFKLAPFNKANQVITFEETYINVGGNFDKYKGVFFAPKTGWYEFSLNGHKGEGDFETTIILRVNGRSVQNVWADSLGKQKFATLFSMHSLLKLQARDQVDLYLKNGAIYDGADKRFTHFTGKLLMEDI